MLSYHLPIFPPLMFKKKSADGSLCFCPLPPLSELNPTVSAWEWAVCLPCSLSSWGRDHRENPCSLLTAMLPLGKIKPCGVEAKPFSHPILYWFYWCSFSLFTFQNQQRKIIKRGTKIQLIIDVMRVEIQLLAVESWKSHSTVLWLFPIWKMDLIIVAVSKAHCKH